MNSKLVLAVLAVVAVGAYFLWPDSDVPEDALEQAGSVAEPMQEESLSPPMPEDMQFPTFRKDADQRQQIQAEIDVLLAEYNEIILPIALSAMKEEE